MVNAQKTGDCAKTILSAEWGQLTGLSQLGATFESSKDQQGGTLQTD